MTMSNKKVVLLVDNRNINIQQSYAGLKGPNVDFKGSAFKSTQIDAEEDIHSASFQDFFYLSQLQKKVEELEQRVSLLENKNTHENKKKRRKTADILRNYQCPHKECARFYGTETSLRNHLKLKHKNQ